MAKVEVNFNRTLLGLTAAVFSFFLFDFIFLLFFVFAFAAGC